MCVRQTRCGLPVVGRRRKLARKAADKRLRGGVPTLHQSALAAERTGRINFVKMARSNRGSSQMDGDDDRKQRLRNRAYALTDLARQRFSLRCIELLSGEDVLESTSKVRRHVIVHRDLRAGTRQCILRNGWDFAVTRIPPGAKSDEFARLSGWSWYQPRHLRVTASMLPSAREFRTLRSTIRDVRMLKGKHEFKGQDRRLATLTGARLNEEAIRLAVAVDDAPNRKVRVRAHNLPPTFGLEPSGATWKLDETELLILRRLNFLPQHGQSWIVADHPDIAAPIKREAEECDAIARALLDGVVTDKERIAGLNERHRAMLESIVGKITYVPPPTKSHPAADIASQTAALDMVFTGEAGLTIWERRDRHNDLLEETEKFTKKGKRYRPGKAGPCTTLTKQARALALADMVYRPPNKGSQRGVDGKFRNPMPKRGTETTVWDDCQKKPPPFEVFTSDFKAEQELQDTRTVT